MMAQREFKALFKSLGLTAEWLAEELDVSEATARLWAAGKAPASKAAIRRLRTLENEFGRYTNALRDHAKQKKRKGPIHLLCYVSDEDLREFQPDFGNLPVTAYQSLAERAKKKLEAAGYAVKIVFMDKKHYSQWLNGRADSIELRIEWIELQGSGQAEKTTQRAAERTAASLRYPGQRSWSLRLKDPQPVIDREAISAEEFNSLVAEYGVTLECVAYIEEVPLETAKKWASGESPAFQDVEFGITVMNTILDSVAEVYLDAVCEPSERTGNKLAGKTVVLGIYPADEDINFFEINSERLPAASHAVAVRRAANTLSAAGCVTRTVFLSRNEYLHWLDGRKDAETLRSEWRARKLNLHDEELWEDDDEHEFSTDITPEKFRELRQAVGLSAEQLAHIHSVEPQIIYSWEAGESDIPGSVAYDLMAYDEKLNDVVNEFRTTIVRQQAKGRGRRIFPMPGFKTDEDLWEYFPEYRPFPVDMHRALLSRLEKVLQDNECLLAVYQFDFSAYRKWLGKRKDSIATRHQWDELQIMHPTSRSVN